MNPLDFKRKFSRRDRTSTPRPPVIAQSYEDGKLPSLLLISLRQQNFVPTILCFEKNILAGHLTYCTINAFTKRSKTAGRARASANHSVPKRAFI
jgi:hypothetical protein